MMSSMALSISNLGSKSSQLAPLGSLLWSAWRPQLKTKAEQQFWVFGFLLLPCGCLVCRTSPGFLPAVFWVGKPAFLAQGLDSWQVLQIETSLNSQYPCCRENYLCTGAQMRWYRACSLSLKSQLLLRNTVCNAPTKSTASHWPTTCLLLPLPSKLE